MKRVYPLFVIVFITSVITGVLLPFSASAASIYDNILHLKAPDNLTMGSSTGLTTADLGEQLVNRTVDSSTCDPTLRAQIIEALEGDNQYYITQINTSVRLYINLGTPSFSPPVWDADNGMLTMPGSSYDAAIVHWSNTTSIYGMSCYNQAYTTTLSSSDGSYKLVEYRGFSLTYPSGYEGETLAPNSNNSTVPDFNYAVSSEKVLTAFYLRNIPNIVSGHRFEYTLFASNSSYEEVEELDSKELDIYPMYQYTLPSNDYYLLKIKHRVPAPGLPMPEIKEVVFKIDFSSGTFLVGGTQYNECSNGVCEPSILTCPTGNFWEKINCQINKNLSFGVINPALIALKQVLTSLTIPEDPACQLPLTNQTVLGKTVPLSTIDDQACSFATTIKETYTIIPIVTNALYALLLIRMIAGVVNRITNPKDAKLVEGI